MNEEETVSAPDKVTTQKVAVRPMKGHEVSVPKLPAGAQYTSADPAKLSHEDAQELGKQIEQMTDDGIPVTPMLLVQRAKDPRNPLHKLFEWNNTHAAEEFRKMQARRLITSLQVVLVERGPRPVRSHFQVTPQPQGAKDGPGTKPAPEYLSVRRAREEPLAREQVFAKAVEELRRWADKYEAFGLDELAPVYEVAAQFGK